MHSLYRFTLLAGVCLLPALNTNAQSAKPGGIHCAVLQAQPLTEADKAFAAGDFDKAEHLYTSQLASAKTVANYAGLMRSQFEQGKVAEAASTAKNAATALPSSSDAASLDGEVLLRSGQIPEANAAYTKAITLDPCTSLGQYGMGRLGDLASNHATAARKYAAAHSLAPSDPAISIALFEKQPAVQQAAGLRAVLAANPVLTPYERDRVTRELAILDQHKSCTATGEARSANLELDPLMIDGKYERSWGLQVAVNSAKSALMELDSSVAGIVLNPKDAENAAVKPLIAGAVTPPYAGYADRIRIGAVEYHDCPVTVATAAALNNGNSLIGTDFFRNNLIHIDYVAKQVTLAPLPLAPGASQDPNVPADQYIAPEEKDWAKAYVAGENLLVPTLINKKGPFLFLVDTGIGRTMITPQLTKALLLAVHDGTTNLRGSSGEIIKVFPKEGGAELDLNDIRDPLGRLVKLTAPVKVPVYRFTNNEYGDEYTVSFDISAKNREAGIDIGGILGFGILQSYFLDFNYRDGLVRIQYDQNRRYTVREMQKSY